MLHIWSIISLLLDIRNCWFVSSLLGEDDVGGGFGGLAVGDLEAEAYQVDSLKGLFALAEEDWGLNQVEFVKEIGLEVLADSGGATADADVFSVGGGLGEF